MSQPTANEPADMMLATTTNSTRSTRRNFITAFFITILIIAIDLTIAIVAGTWARSGQYKDYLIKWFFAMTSSTALTLGLGGYFSSHNFDEAVSALRTVMPLPRIGASIAGIMNLPSEAMERLSYMNEAIIASLVLGIINILDSLYSIITRMFGSQFQQSGMDLEGSPAMSDTPAEGDAYKMSRHGNSDNAGNNLLSQMIQNQHALESNLTGDSEKDHLLTEPEAASEAVF
ncbi:hypothetical protein OG21DRAFT_1498280 [Imleria badia]|nr:hypothetical protein OG21DRAFT_1498280 [Imleria badia]